MIGLLVNLFEVMNDLLILYLRSLKNSPQLIHPTFVLLWLDVMNK